MGLAITKHIAQQHDGKLIADNVAPNGLKMHFIFPKYTPPAGHKKTAAQHR